MMLTEMWTKKKCPRCHYKQNKDNEECEVCGLSFETDLKIYYPNISAKKTALSTLLAIIVAIAIILVLSSRFGPVMFILTIIGGLFYIGVRFKNKSQPSTSDIQVKTYIRSASGRGQYEIDEHDLTCDCPDFKKRRASYSKEDPRRLCKHLIAAKRVSDIEDVHEAAIFSDLQENFRGYHLGNCFRTKINGKTITAFLPMQPGHPWINVFIEKDRYGYNIVEDRWAYGEAPDESIALERWLNDCWDDVF